ncbi:hypothetical protein T439DRAFT_326634 [Meredithblackwellia eburnea MCA 4105]
MSDDSLMRSVNSNGNEVDVSIDVDLPAQRQIPKAAPAGGPLSGGYNLHKVYIGNLPDTATLADLEDCFGQLGQCACSIKRGFGFVEYVDPACAAEAVAKYHEGHFLGAQIKVELSHARQAPPKREERAPQRNPPGSDRPSDTRKPMYINGPPAPTPTGEKSRGNRGGRNNSNSGPPPLASAPYDSRRDFPPSDRFGPGPSAPPLPPPLRDVPYDRYRDDYRDPRAALAPGGYPDPRYSREYDRGYGSAYGARDPYGAPPAAGYPPPPLPRDSRDRPPYDPYYDAPPPRDSWGSTPPIRGGPPPPPPLGGNSSYPPFDSQRPYAPLPPSSRDPYASDRYGPGPGGPPPAPYDRPPSYPPRDAYGALPPPPSAGLDDRYDPRSSAPLRDDRSQRYNPYGSRSPPRDDRRSIDYGGRSPRGGGPERRRSLSPRRDGGGYRGGDYGPPPPGGAYGGGGYYSSGGRSPPRYPQDEYSRR